MLHKPVLTQSKPGPFPRPPTRTKSKTGCKTCKVRRIRCGEERPACQKCLSTGRVCDGYGIWGGGGNRYGERCTGHGTARAPEPLIPASYLGGPTSNLDADEKFHFEWFWCRTARKIPGAFFSEKGNALFFQACASDRAVTHAVLAMCAVHRRSHNGGSSERKLVASSCGTVCGEEEDFALRQYNKAIRHLQRHLGREHEDSDTDTTSLRIALFSCVAFVFVELFRGFYRSAGRHLEHGLQMLACAKRLLGAERFAENRIDEWVVGVFRKLYVQATWFGQRPRHPWPFEDPLQLISTVTIFSGAHEARDYLDNILLDICEVMETRSKQFLQTSGKRQASEDIAGPIERDLNAWFPAYRLTLALLECRMDKVEAFACRMLGAYHTMAIIMLDTVRETEESKYDRHTSEFLSIIQHMLEMRRIAANAEIRRRFFGSEEGMSHSIGDIGLIAPLYYVAVKCRVRRLRLCAIRMLEETPHKEGIHDAILTANIARKVMALEEDDTLKPGDREDDFSLLEPPLAEHWTLQPLIPESDRVQVLDVLLPDGPWDPAILKCRYQNATAYFKISQQPFNERKRSLR